MRLHPPVLHPPLLLHPAGFPFVATPQLLQPMIKTLFNGHLEEARKVFIKQGKVNQ
jgi:hypothetical protein